MSHHHVIYLSISINAITKYLNVVCWMWCRRQWENPDKNTPYAAYTATMYVDFILTFGLIARWCGWWRNVSYWWDAASVHNLPHLQLQDSKNMLNKIFENNRFTHKLKHFEWKEGGLYMFSGKGKVPKWKKIYHLFENSRMLKYVINMKINTIGQLVI